LKGFLIGIQNHQTTAFFNLWQGYCIEFQSKRDSRETIDK